MKYSISGPMKKAVIRVPIPGNRPVRVPMMTQSRSQPIRTKRKGSFRLSDMTMGIASYTETPRLEVMYRDDAKHMTRTAMARNSIRRARVGVGAKWLITLQVKSTM